MASELLIRSPAADLYARALVMAYRSGIRIWDPSVAQAREPDIESKLLRDADIATGVKLRQHMIAGSDWYVEPATDSDENKEAAKVMRELLKRLRGFTQARHNLARAFLSGQRFASMEGGAVWLPVGDGQQRMWNVVLRLRDHDKRRFRWVPNEYAGDDKPITTRLEVLSVRKGDWIEVQHPEWLIKHTYDDSEEMLGYGRGLREACYWWWYAKEHLFRESLQAAERFGQGIIAAKIAGVKDANNQPNTALIQAWKSALTAMRAEHVMVFDKDDEVEVINMSGQGWQLMTTLREELRTTLRTLILGASMTTNNEGGAGSHGLARVQQESTESLLLYDRETLEETLTEDLIGYLWRANWHNLREMGLEGAEMPRFKIKQERTQDPQTFGGVLTVALQSGVKVRAEDAYDGLGLTQPKDGDEILEPPQPDDGMGGGGMGGVGMPGGGPNEPATGPMGQRQDGRLNLNPQTDLVPNLDLTFQRRGGPLARLTTFEEPPRETFYERRRRELEEGRRRDPVQFRFNPTQSRGQPGNAGQFGPGGGSSKGSKKGGKAARRTAKRRGARRGRKTGSRSRRQLAVAQVLAKHPEWDKTPEGAMAAAKALGMDLKVSKYDIQAGGELARVAMDYARGAVQTAARMKAAGFKPPAPVVINSDAAQMSIQRNPRLSSSFAWFDAGRNRVVVNPMKDHGGLKRLHESGWVAGDSPADAIAHEMGHALHRKGDPKRFGSILTSIAEATKDAAKVKDVQAGWDPQQLEGLGADGGIGSRYGMTNPLEYVAEAFVHQMRGGRLGKAAKRAYKALGGPMLDELSPEELKKAQLAQMQEMAGPELDEIAFTLFEHDESKHPRDADGKWTSGSGGGTATKDDDEKPTKATGIVTRADNPNAGKEDTGLGRGRGRAKPTADEPKEKVRHSRSTLRGELQVVGDALGALKAGARAIAAPLVKPIAGWIGSNPAVSAGLSKTCAALAVVNFYWPMMTKRVMEKSGASQEAARKACGFAMVADNVVPMVPVGSAAVMLSSKGRRKALLDVWREDARDFRARIKRNRRSRIARKGEAAQAAERERRRSKKGRKGLPSGD